MPKKKKQSSRKKSDLKMQAMLDAKFSEAFGEIQTERFGNEKITQMNVADANLDFVRLFGANKNLYRSTPNLICGLKPGAVRLYYTWWETSKKPQNTKRETLQKIEFFKVNKLASDSVKYHPHGTSSQEEIIGTAGQYWSNNVMLIVPQGSYGNMRGEDPAAGRYLESSLSEYAIDCFFDHFDDYSIPMRLSYTGKDYEPLYLPAKYPHILFNPQFSGLGYGTASNIPPFNVSEVLDATIKLIKNPDAKILLYPDSPTGADIIDDGQFKEINKTGVGNFVMKACSEIDYANNVIKITALPLNSASKDVIQKIVEFREKGNKEFKHIIKFDDNTQEGFVEILIYLDGKESTNPNKVLKELYKKHVGLRSTFPVGITAIDDFRLGEYGIRELLLAWIDYRLDAVQSMFLNSYQKTLDSQHTNNVLLMVFAQDNIDDTIKIAKESKTKKETEQKLMKRFKISSAQAEVIANMHVYQFNKDQYQKYVDNAKKLEDDLKYIRNMLEGDGTIEDFVIEQLKEGKKKYGGPRRSRIIKAKDEDKTIKDTEHILTISESGYMKKLPGDAVAVGIVGKTNSPITTIHVGNRESILVIDASGMLTKIPVSEIPDVDVDHIGIPIAQLFPVSGDIKAVMELPTMDILDQDDDDICIVFVTSQGLAKRVKLSEFKSLDRSKRGIVLNNGDTVATAMFSFDASARDIIIYTNLGKGIRLPIEDVRLYGAASKGMPMVKLDSDEFVVGASKVDPNAKFFFFITDSGKGKIVEVKYLHVMKRTDDLINLTKLDDGEQLLGVSSVNKGDVVFIYRKKTDPDEIRISDMEVSARLSSCAPLVKNVRSNHVVGYKVYKKK